MKGINLSEWAVTHRPLTLFLILLVSLSGACQWCSACLTVVAMLAMFSRSRPHVCQVGCLSSFSLWSERGLTGHL